MGCIPGRPGSLPHFSTSFGPFKKRHDYIGLFFLVSAEVATAMFWPGRSSLEPPGAPDRAPMSTAHARGSCAAPGAPARHQEAHGVPCLCRWTSPDRPVGQAPNPRRRSRTGPAHLDPGRRQAMIWSSGMVSCPHMYGQRQGAPVALVAAARRVSGVQVHVRRGHPGVCKAEIRLDRTSRH